MSNKKKIDVLRQIVKARDSIRRKHLALKVGKEASQHVLKSAFKPVTTPLEKIITKLEPPERRNEVPTISESNETTNVSEKNEIPNVSEKSFKRGVITSSTPVRSNLQASTSYTEDESDSTTFDATVLDLAPYEVNENDIQSYFKMFDNKSQLKQLENGRNGVRFKKGLFKIGNGTLGYKGNKILVNNEEYKATRGLLELLFKKIPASYMITPADEAAYGKILNDTSAFHLNFDSTKPTREDNNDKFFKYVAKHITKTGGSLPRYMITSTAPINYVHWDDPNELVD